MADIPAWLRGFRSRTPVPTTSIGEPQIFIDNTEEEAEEAEEEMAKESSRLRPATRVSSLLAFGRPAASSFTASEAFPAVTDAEHVWHNPNADQMVETLMVIMMTKPSTEPVPVECNTLVMHVLEAYRKLRADVTKIEARLHESVESHQEDARLYEELATQWRLREEDYKSEMKKLEIIIAHGTHTGMEAVVMARSQSVLQHKRASTEKLEQGILRFESRRKSRGPMTPSTLQSEFPTIHDYHIFRSLAAFGYGVFTRAYYPHTTNRSHGSLQTNANLDTEPMMPRLDPDPDEFLSKALTVKEHSLPHRSRTRRGRQQPGPSSYPRKDSVTSASSSDREMDQRIKQRLSMEGDPNTVTSHRSYSNNAASETVVKDRHDISPSQKGIFGSIESQDPSNDGSGSSVAQPRAFSFVPGDDTHEIKPLGSATANLHHQALQDYARNFNPSNLLRSSDGVARDTMQTIPEPHEHDQQQKQNRLKTDKHQLLQEEPLPIPVDEPSSRKCPSIKESSSRSSVVTAARQNSNTDSIRTAVKDDSRRGSREVSSTSSTTGSNLERSITGRRGSGSSVAAIAAARAIAGSNKETVKQIRKTSL